MTEVKHHDQCPVLYGAPLTKCSCEQLEVLEQDPMKTVTYVAIAGFAMFSIGVAWRFGIDISLATDGALLMACAVAVVLRGGSNESGT